MLRKEKSKSQLMSLFPSVDTFKNISIDWRWKKYDELSIFELYDILKHRNEIFIVEKKCPWAEIDGKDNCALHLLGYDRSNLVAYARLICPKNENDSIYFGRVLVVKEHRGKNIGNTIIKNIMDKIIALGYQSNRIEILVNVSPQTEKLYKKFGFKATASSYKVEGGSGLIPMSCISALSVRQSMESESISNDSGDNRPSLYPSSGFYGSAVDSDADSKLVNRYR